jgi:predicted acetyltransferase
MYNPRVPADRSSPLSFRSARPADLERLVAIHASAFPDARGFSERRTNFTHNVRGKYSELIVAHDENEILAHAFLFRSTGFFGGLEAQVGSIASIGVAPEARGRGIGKSLMEELHRLSAARGDALALLYPFRAAFYAPLGYGPVTSFRRLAISPESIPREWIRSDKTSVVRAMHPKDRASIEALYETVARTKTGRMRRTSALWDRFFLDERRAWFVAIRDRNIVGYVVWSTRQVEEHARTSLIVHEITAIDDLTKRLLFGLIGAQRDQVTSVFLETDAKDPIDSALLDPDSHVFGTLALEHPFGEVATGPVVRIHDPKKAIEARGFTNDGRAILKIEKNAPVEIRVESGRASIHATREKPQMTLDRRCLASLLYGAISPSDASAIALCTIHRDAAELDRLFALPPFFAMDPF